MERSSAGAAARLMSQAPRLLGTILPSANTVVERTTQAMLRDPGTVVPLFTRVAWRGAADPFPDAHDREGLLAAACLLADAGPDALVWSSGKGAEIGLDHDRDLVARVRAATGLPCVTCGLALLQALAAFGVTRIALVGPQARGGLLRAARVLAAEGIEVVAEASLGLADTRAFAGVEYAAIADLVRRVAGAPGVQAVVAWNSNCAAAPLAAAMEEAWGVPLLDATALGVWAGLRAAGIDSSPGPSWGRLFTLDA